MLLKELYLSNNELISLATYFEKEFNHDIKLNLDKKLPTNLLNFDTALDGGISPELYLLAGAEFSTRHSMLLYLAEQFADAGYNVLYFSKLDSLKSIMRKFVMRYDFKLHRDLATTLPSIIDTLDNSPNLKRLFRQKIHEILSQIYVSNLRNNNISEIEQKVYEFKQFGKVAVLIDEYQTVPFNELDTKSYQSKFSSFNRISQINEVPIIIMENLPKETYSNLWKGHLIHGGFENDENILLFSEDVNTVSINTTKLVEIKFINNSSHMDGRIIPLIYYPTHYYFQDA